MSKIIIQFNEANFDFISKYCKKYHLPNLEKIINFQTKVLTSSEKEYEHLEPWIQWYSFYTGMKYADHRVAHLGDCLKKDHISFFDQIASKENKVGLFCAMNHKFNSNFEVFIPDPWTNTTSDNSMNSRLVSYALRFVVNNNARFKLNFLSLFGLLIIIFPSMFNLRVIFKSIVSFLNKDRASLAAYFDLFFLRYTLKRIKKNELDQSLIFLNGLAHIQHHFLKTSEFLSGNQEEDKILKCLKIYDTAFDFLNYFQDDNEIWFITALTQEKFTKDLNYWRLRDHDRLLEEIIEYNFSCAPRMTRDFELTFTNRKYAELAKESLSECFIFDGEKKEPAFGFFDLENKSLFASFIFSGANKNVDLIYKNKKINLQEKIDFIAKKDGGHIGKGWAFSNAEVNFLEDKPLPIWEMNKLIL